MGAGHGARGGAAGQGKSARFFCRLIWLSRLPTAMATHKSLAGVLNLGQLVLQLLRSSTRLTDAVTTRSLGQDEGVSLTRAYNGQMPGVRSQARLKRDWQQKHPPARAR